MDATTAVTGVNQVTIPTSTTAPSTVDYDAFLQLLVTQLQNQDPTEPTDNAELMSQLASFSSVEQQVQMNEKLDQLITSNTLGDASNLIGKVVTSADGLTSGVVHSVILAEGGIYAELQNGTKVPITTGTVISEAETDDPTSQTAQSEDPLGDDNTGQFGLF